MIYLDNSATTKPYPEVVDSFAKVALEYFGNPSSLHQLGGTAEKLLSQARAQIAKLLQVKDTEIVFTSGGTESNNLAIKGTALMYRGRGKHIITTEVEHASVREAMEQLKDLGFQITYIKPDQFGRISVNELEKAITPDTILVSVIHVQNEVGAIQPIKEIGTMLKEYPKILFHVDHVQGIGKVPLNLIDCGIDLCSLSGHKFHGLKGTGVLYLREGLQISPLFSGGNQEFKQRSGTENVPGMVAMAKALRLTMDSYQDKRDSLIEVMQYLKNELETISEIIIHTPKDNAAPHILNFSIKGFKGEVFVHALADKGVYVSTTSACSSRQAAISKTLLAMGISQDEAKSAIRLSLSYQNTIEEAKTAIKAIKATINQLGEVMK